MWSNERSIDRKLKENGKWMNVTNHNRRIRLSIPFFTLIMLVGANIRSLTPSASNMNKLITRPSHINASSDDSQWNIFAIISGLLVHISVDKPRMKDRNPNSGGSRPWAKGWGGGGSFVFLALPAFLPSVISSYYNPKWGRGRPPGPSPSSAAAKEKLSSVMLAEFRGPWSIWNEFMVVF